MAWRSWLDRCVGRLRAGGANGMRRGQCVDESWIIRLAFGAWYALGGR